MNKKTTLCILALLVAGTAFGQHQLTYQSYMKDPDRTMNEFNNK